MIAIIVAVDKNNLIGKGDNLPWNFKEDLLYFKEKTMGKFVVMGEKTYRGIKKNLKGRKIIVLSRDKNFPGENIFVARSIKEAISISQGELMVAGGRTVYEQFLKIADRLYLTVIDESFEGDVYFPKFEEKEWTLTEEKKGKNSALTFKIFDRCN
jgi:dihydrofolate reductase